ncbi:hypothetical protein, partial [Pseudomonas sp. AMR01]|uniref:hypothetical protein n=1 Tax=Pseudomonas sp. AMR01 TaxID=3064904 RepID=UPI0035C0BDBA
MMDLVADAPHSRASPLPQLDLHFVWDTAIRLGKNRFFDPAIQVWELACGLLKLHSVKTVGAGLLAKAVDQLMDLVADTPHSRA